MLSQFYVFSQFFYITLLIYFAEFSSFSPLFFLFAILSILLAIWIFYHNKIGNFNIVPELKEQTKLILSGPYSYVRHPMYSSVLIGSSAFLFQSTSLRSSLLSFFLLFITLIYKAKREEKFLSERFPNYQVAMSNKKRFFPFVV